jgi:hypothetical protein
MSDDSDETEIPDFEELNKDAEVDRNPNKPPKYSDLPACDICGQRYDFTVPEKVVEFSDERYRHFDTTKWICTKCYLDELKKSTRLSDKQAIAVAYFLQSSTNDPASAAGMTEEQMADIIESLKEEVAEARKLVDLAGDLQWTLHPEVD